MAFLAGVLSGFTSGRSDPMPTDDDRNPQVRRMRRALTDLGAPVPEQWVHASDDTFTFDALMAPVVVCGAFAGFWLLKRIPQQAFDTLMLVLATISALFLFR